MPRSKVRYRRCKPKSSATCRNCVPKFELGWRSSEKGLRHFKIHPQITMPCCRHCASSPGAASRHLKPTLPWLPPSGSPLHRPHRPLRPLATSPPHRPFLRSVASQCTAPLPLPIPVSPLRDHRHRIGITFRLKVRLSALFYVIITINANRTLAPGPILLTSSSQSGIASRPPSRAPSRAPSAGGGSRGGSHTRT